MHEGNRVYRDKLVEERDMEMYDKIQKDMTSKFFEVCFEADSHSGKQASDRTGLFSFLYYSHRRTKTYMYYLNIFL